MPRVDLVVETEISQTPRARQLCGMFDVPASEMLRMEWRTDVPLEQREWNVGLIVGPSGAGKSQCARHLFGDHVDVPLSWGGAGVIDDFRQGLGIEEITAACQAVGFNTIPAWLRPFSALSNGERFRVELARRLLELPDPVVVDEFSSVVDRQVAQIGSFAVQKWARREKRQFVAVSCHYDIVDWLQPDWIFEPATRQFTWRALQRRPELAISITRVPYSVWQRFAPFHYLTMDLHRAARCFVLFVEDRMATFIALLPRPISSGRHSKPIWGGSRIVTLPDFQGLGLAFVMCDRIAAAMKDLGTRMRVYPAHPAFVRSFDRAPRWKLLKKPGRFEPRTNRVRNGMVIGAFINSGGRPNATFEYVGPAAGDRAQSRGLWEGAMR